MNMNMKVIAHKTLETVEANLRTLREKIAESMSDDDKLAWNEAVDACAAVVEECSKTPQTRWGEVKTAILKLKK